MRGLFIGIGGTGDEILARLKDKVAASVDSVPETLQFRLIDTEAEDYRKNKGARLGGSSSQIAIAGNEYLQLKDDPAGTFVEYTAKAARNADSLPEISRWYRADLFQQNLPDADFNLVRGAGQHRHFARMGVYLNKQRLTNMLQIAMEKCGGGAGELPIWIVGSIAGGTGAGLFMDLALLTRLVSKELRLRTRVIGAAVLPEVFSEVGIDMARANAVLRELERFQAPVENPYLGRMSDLEDGIRFTVEYDTGSRVQLTGKLFDNLVFYNRKCRDIDERNGYFSEIADGLNLLLDETAGDEIFRSWINAQEGKATSFNTHRIFLPIKLYRRQFVLEAALEIANKLLPRNPDNQQILFSSPDDRVAEAKQILTEELYELFRVLSQPVTDKDFQDTSEQMTPSYVVNEMLGFANPAGVFGKAIGEERSRAALRLYANIFNEIQTVRDVKEDFDDSKLRISAEVELRRRDYEGDGQNSFSKALTEISPLVESHIATVIDESARGYLNRQKVDQEALGRANRVYIELGSMLSELLTNLERIVKNDRSELEQVKGEEKDAKVDLDQLTKKLIGWRGQLADVEERYLNSVNTVNQRSQRQKLVAFLKEMLKAAQQRTKLWQDGMQHWLQAIDRVVEQAGDESREISQRLDRLTKVKSASMGLKNTVEMDGYREELRTNCLQNDETGESFVEELLRKLSWKPGERPQDLMLEDWPADNTALSAQDFSHALGDYLEERINKRVETFQGMARYIKWLRDEKRDDPSLLADKLRVAKDSFLDMRATSETRKLLMLHGDNWRQEYGKDAFDSIFNALSGASEFRGLQSNLTDSNGVNLFGDRNILAILIVDTEIPYQEISVVKAMQDAYYQVRNQNDSNWRAQTYHLFRCDQEAWKIEQAMVVQTRDTRFPEIPGELSRLLDAPKLVELFAKALATGIIREKPVAAGGKIWVCGKLHDGEERDLIYLNDPDDEQDTRDLLRALVTFVIDGKDRRRRVRGNLDERLVLSWLEEHLAIENKTLEQVVAEFKLTNPELFELRLNPEHAGESRIDKQAFIALTLSYYLRNFLNPAV